MKGVVLSCIVLFTILTGGGLLRAQEFTLRLTLLDVSNDEPLPFVSVQLDSTTVSGTTDDRGFVVLKAPAGTYRLRASSTGYEPFSEALDLTADLEAVLRLQPSSTRLQTVTVTDRDARRELTRARMGVEQLSGSEISSIPAVLGERDVLRALQLRPGVTAAGEASNGISVRGGTIDQNLLLLDGAPVFTPTHLFGLFSVFTPEAVGGVDLYRGNIPARFGGRIASVLDVRSRAPTVTRPVLKGGLGVVASELSLETPLGADDRWGLLLAGRAGFNSFVFPVIERLKNTRSRFGDATLKLRYRAGEKDIFTLTGFYADDYYRVDLVNAIGSISATANDYRYLTLNAGLEWFHQFGDRWSSTASAHLANYDPELRFPQEDGSEIAFRSAIDYTILRSAVTYESDVHRVVGGLQFDDYRLRAGKLLPNGSTSVLPIELEAERGQEMVAYLEEEWTPGDRFTLAAGLRVVQYRQRGPGQRRIYREESELTAANLERSEDVGAGNTLRQYGGLEPRLGVSYGVTERTNVKLSYARSRQYLQNIYNATTPLPTSRWKVSDANVGPQSADLYSAGISHLTAGEDYSLRVETYYRAIDDLLEYKPGADFFLNPTVETDLIRGEGRAYGVELSARRLTGRVTGELNYAYARVENRVEGPTFTTRINRGEWYPGYFDQPHTLSARMTIDEGMTHELGFNLVVQSNRPYTAPNGFVEVGGRPVPLFLERNNDRLPVYHRLDFSWTINNFRRQQRRWTGQWVFTVYNVYGRDNAYNIYYQAKTANTQALGIFSKSPFAAYRLSIFGAPILSLSYKFTFLP